MRQSIALLYHILESKKVCTVSVFFLSSQNRYIQCFYSPAIPDISDSVDVAQRDGRQKSQEAHGEEEEVSQMSKVACSLACILEMLGKSTYVCQLYESPIASAPSVKHARWGVSRKKKKSWQRHVKDAAIRDSSVAYLCKANSYDYWFVLYHQSDETASTNCVFYRANAFERVSTRPVTRSLSKRWGEELVGKRLKTWSKKSGVPGALTSI